VRAPVSLAHPDSAIRRLFGGAHVVAESVPREFDGELFPEEQEYIRGAALKRRAEFGTARVCARTALAAMGVPATALVPRSDRSPTWPMGIVGSITHTGGYCAVVVDRGPPLLSVGLDAEELRVLEPGVASSILTPREQSWLSAQAPASRDDLVILFFSAKEAYYKCQYPITGRFLEFGDVEVEIASGLGRYEARVRHPRSASPVSPASRVSLAPASLARLEGRFAYDGGRVLCGIEFFG
jgi:4'-phosphopantetheinyl transferase EntD